MTKQALDFSGIRAWVLPTEDNEEIASSFLFVYFVCFCQSPLFLGSNLALISGY
jgi:hypothetical protein